MAFMRESKVGSYKQFVKREKQEKKRQQTMQERVWSVGTCGAHTKKN
jgi:hypothetical protein